MPTLEPTEINPEHPRHTITLLPGEKVVVCRCWQSKKFPFCDGTHREIEGRGPCVIVTPAPAGPGENP